MSFKISSVGWIFIILLGLQITGEEKLTYTNHFGNYEGFRNHIFLENINNQLILKLLCFFSVKGDTNCPNNSRLGIRIPSIFPVNLYIAYIFLFLTENVCYLLYILYVFILIFINQHFYFIKFERV